MGSVCASFFFDPNVHALSKTPHPVSPKPFHFPLVLRHLLIKQRLWQTSRVHARHEPANRSVRFITVALVVSSHSALTRVLRQDRKWPARLCFRHAIQPRSVIVYDRPRATAFRENFRGPHSNTSVEDGSNGFGCKHPYVRPKIRGRSIIPLAYLPMLSAVRSLHPSRDLCRAVWLFVYLCN